MKRNLLFCCLLAVNLFFLAPRLNAQCATNAYISAGDNCISLSWYPNSAVPNPLPASIEFNGSVYNFHDGSGDLAFPAVFKKTAADCLLPSDYVNGDLTINFAGSSSSCHYPGGTLLALHDINFTGVAKAKQTFIRWSTNATNITRFDIQRTAGKGDFKTVGSVAAGEPETGTKQYSFTDELTADSYYRLKVVEANNLVWYSRVIKVTADEAAALDIYPNPNKGSFTLNGIDPVSLKSMMIYDAQGRKLSYKLAATGPQSATVVLKNKTTGILMISCTSGTAVTVRKVLVQ